MVGAPSSDVWRPLSRLAAVDKRVDAPLVLGLPLAVVQRSLLGRHSLDLRRRAMSLRLTKVRLRLGHEVARPPAEVLERRLRLLRAARAVELRRDVDLLDREHGVQLVP